MTQTTSATPFPLPQKVTRAEKAVGAILVVLVLAGAGHAAWGIVSERWLPGPSRYWFTAPEGYGVGPGTAVRMNGIPVGAVDRVDLDQHGQVRVDFHVRGDYAPLLVEESGVEVDVPALMGDVAIAIRPPLFPSGVAQIQSGSEILDVRLPDVPWGKMGVRQEDVTKLVANFEAVMDLVQRTTSDLDRLLAGVRGGEGSLGALISDRKVADQVEAMATHVDAILDKVDRAMGTAGRLAYDPAMRDEVALVQAELDRTAEGMRDLTPRIQTTVERLDKAVSNLVAMVDETRGMAEGVAGGQGTIGRLLQDERLFEDAQRFMAEAREKGEDSTEQTLAPFLAPRAAQAAGVGGAKR